MIKINKKVPFSIAILIIIILASVVGGVTIWQYFKISKENYKEEKMENNGTEIDSWKTYEYSEELKSAWGKKYKYYYKVDYPSDWEIEYPNKYNPGQIRIIADKETIEIQPGLWGAKQDSNDEALYFAYRIALTTYTLNGFNAQLDEDMSFNGYPGKKLVYIHSDYPGVFETCYLIQKDRITYILKSVSPKLTEDNNIFQKIFASFEI